MKRNDSTTYQKNNFKEKMLLTKMYFLRKKTSMLLSGFFRKNGNRKTKVYLFFNDLSGQCFTRNFLKAKHF